DVSARLLAALTAAALVLALLATACSSSHAADPAASTATQANVSPVVVLVHGFSPTPDGYSCADYWGDLETVFRRGDPGVKLVTAGFRGGDHDGDMTMGSGGPYTPIEDVARRLADDLYQRYSAPGIPVVLVGHSMGGLVVRSALAQAGSKAGPP